MINYGKQTIENDDINSVLQVLKTNTFLTTGPWVDKFENKVCKYVNSKYGVAVNSGTAALHCACAAINIQKGDEVIVPTVSFVASSNCILYCEGTPVFCDIDPNTLNIDYTKIEALITEKTKAIIIVDMCGQPCDFDQIKLIADKYNLIIIEDASHSIGSIYKNKKVGSYADLTTFSFHPVKNMTTAEGGMVVTNNELWYNKMKSFRSHGINRDYKAREKGMDYKYDMTMLGFNYRLPDLNCSLGISQLDKLDKFIELRRKVHSTYLKLFEKYNLFKHFTPIEEKSHNISAFHLFVIKINSPLKRDLVYKYLRKNNIGCNVHYMPIHLHTYYQTLGWKKNDFPVSEKVCNQILSLPIFPTLSQNDINKVINTLLSFVKRNIV